MNKISRIRFKNDDHDSLSLMQVFLAVKPVGMESFSFTIFKSVTNVGEF